MREHVPLLIIIRQRKFAACHFKPQCWHPPIHSRVMRSRTYAYEARHRDGKHTGMVNSGTPLSSFMRCFWKRAIALSSSVKVASSSAAAGQVSETCAQVSGCPPGYKYTVAACGPPPKRLSMKALDFCSSLYSTSSVFFLCSQQRH